MKLLYIIIIAILLAGTAVKAESPFYSFKAKTIDGEEFDFSKLKGKRVLIVNVASFCGYTKQYKELQELFVKHGGEKFTMIGFPANNFGKQEPHDDATIKKFCTEKFGVTFQMMSKISVKGDDMHDIYKWLTQKDLNGVLDSEVHWNFQKYFVDENGIFLATLGTKVDPLAKSIVEWASWKADGIITEK